PLIALGLLWFRRDLYPMAAARPNWWGVALIAAGAGLQVAGAYLYVRWLCGASLIPALAGLAVLVGGWPALRWAGPSIGFLVFMIPLPFRVESLMQQPLRSVSTWSGAYTLQLMGLPVLAEG